MPDDCGGVLVLEDVEGESVERLRFICIVVVRWTDRYSFAN